MSLEKIFCRKIEERGRVVSPQEDCPQCINPKRGTPGCPPEVRSFAPSERDLPASSREALVGYWEAADCNPHPKPGRRGWHRWGRGPNRTKRGRSKRIR